MSSHFGRAEWIMIDDTESHGIEFVKNNGLNGKSAVETVIRQGCTDVIFAEIGNGAFGHLSAAGIRGWVAPEDITGQQALQLFGQLALQPANASTKQGGGHGCCCSKLEGSEVFSCCRG
ncbi:MAG: NifB/NifX family molybdenum-iron cluster-binding protein [Terracidiphilus sp.]